MVKTVKEITKLQLKTWYRLFCLILSKLISDFMFSSEIYPNGFNFLNVTFLCREAEGDKKEEF